MNQIRLNGTKAVRHLANQPDVDPPRWARLMASLKPVLCCQLGLHDPNGASHRAAKTVYTTRVQCNDGPDDHRTDSSDISLCISCNRFSSSRSSTG
jgi:hypothetical protein